MMLHAKKKLIRLLNLSPKCIKMLTTSSLLAIIAFIASTKIIITEQYNNNYDLHSTTVDEATRVAHRLNYQTSSSGQHSQSLQQINHDGPKQSKTNLNSILANEKQLPSILDGDNIDPFSVTFEDYLKEASKSSAHHIVDDSSEVSSFSTEKPAISLNKYQTPASLTIEEEDNLIKPKVSTDVDYIFPSNKQETTIYDQNKHENLEKNLRKYENKDTNLRELLNEIKLLFAWKKLPTNKCSKSCGKGYRLNHLSCIDLKFEVRVEDSLCIKANIPKPNETSDETCNEIDCLPEWTSIEYQECNSSNINNDICHPNIYKKVQCMMVDKNGNSIQLDDSKCNITDISKSSNNNLLVDANGSDKDRTNEHSENIQTNDDGIEIYLDNIISENNDRNDISSNLNDQTEIHQHHYTLSDISTGSKSHPHDEPFYLISPWSECQGSCGQLGKRTRKVSCKLYLLKSAKFVELPEKSCHHLNAPDTDEPCYMDCLFENDINKKNISDFKIINEDNIDETVYDLDITRYIWRYGGYTKCSADCLGGKKEKIIECWDTVFNSPVDSSLCEENIKPKTVIESCNEIPCQPNWDLGKFSDCSKSCGSAGIKIRLVHCIQRVSTSEGHNSIVVSDDLCIQSSGYKPDKVEACNRVDCLPEWSVGPWSECSNKCGEGIRNRTVICVKEFAYKIEPSQREKYNPDFLEAIDISNKDWYPGKATQIPFHECYQQYRTIPVIDEKCYNYCEIQPFIDADQLQNYQLSWDNMRKKTVTLKVGGKAEIMEGRNLKIRCKLINRMSHDNLVKKSNFDPIEWRKDGIKIFSNGSTMADKLYVLDDNNMITNDISLDEKNQFMADDPNSRSSNSSSIKLNKTNNQKQRTLTVRSSSSSNFLDYNGNFTFVPKIGGRFSLIKDNILKIKKLTPDDSGLYKCSYGSISESLELKVLSKQEFIKFGDKKRGG